MKQDSSLRSIQKQADAWFVRLRSDHSGEADRDAFAVWLAADPEHARAYAEAERLWQSLEMPARRAHRRALVYSRHLRGLRRAVVGLPVVACLLLAVWPWAHESLRAWRGDYVTAWGQTRGIALADGSHVTLNSHSRLDLAFDGKNRGVRLVEGEAYFEVAEDAARPFVVVAGEGEVTVVGTRFNVYDDGTRVTVTVAEGRVRVSAGGGEASLSSGRQATYNAAGVGRVSLADVGAVLAWRQGRLVFKLRPLAEVVETINRHSTGKIVIVGSATERRVVSGVFKAHDPEQSLKTLQAMLGLSTARLPGGVTVLYQ